MMLTSPNRSRLLPLLGLSLLLAGACTQDGAALASGAQAPAVPVAPARVVKAPTPESLAQSRQAVLGALGQRCTSSADCATLGIGARACGGPEQFLAYAPADSDLARARAAAAEFAALRSRQQQAWGEASTCAVLPDPGAMCTAAGQCVLREAGRGGGANSLIR